MDHTIVLAVDPTPPTGIDGLGAWVGGIVGGLGPEFWGMAAILVPIGLGIWGAFFLIGKGKKSVKA